ncbi:c-type cytochrome domain-containing protein [Alienimonas californiensis]|uniref:WD domain, G-beta repeat n=1 Tax=Alienimonas californiensis TaxID=2527989 RepID=A0A517P9H1_9PLAN|nr:c-type cytochrome domain-containing protein [Alienimonas californiensis]QDT16026.1 WD domain, G-beta repeat [Alienimonas californiensis]
MPAARFAAVALLVLVPAAWAPVACAAEGEAQGPDFDREIRPLLTKYCAGCHNAGESSGEFAVHDHSSLMRGGYEGAVIAPGDAAESRLFGLLDGSKGELMPPEDEPRPTAEEVVLLRAWINAGAVGGGDLPTLVVPEVKVTAETVREPVHALAVSPDGKTVAVGRYGRVELRDAGGEKPVRTLTGVPGHVHSLHWLEDEKVLAAAGEPGLGGAVVVWDTNEFSESGDAPAYVLRGHADAILAAALSPDRSSPEGRTLATGGYDKVVRLWDPATGLEKAVLAGHNGPVFGVAFHPTLPLLATASDDRTIKLWDAGSGELKDTLTEPAGAQLCVAFTPDGAHLLAAGGDRTLRAWELTGEGRQGTTKVRLSQFVHRGPVLSLSFTPTGQLVTAAEDATVKLWDRPADMKEGFSQVGPAIELPDWPAAVAVRAERAEGNAVRALVGLLDGTVRRVSFEPREPGDAPPAGDGEAGGAGEQIAVMQDAPGREAEPNDDPADATPMAPASVFGVIDEPGDEDLYRFAAAPGSEWVLECVAQTEGGKPGSAPTDPLLEILRPDGEPVMRVKLQATRASVINFRPIDSKRSNDTRLDFWEEMELNEYLYMNGEVVKFFQAPKGPDSGWVFYERPGNSHRLNYFGTSATAHALFEPVYTVAPHSPDADLPDNGLPVFEMNYANDDDPQRELGDAARIHFTAPAVGSSQASARGEYLVRVRDVRGEGGPDYAYKLTLREPAPGFTASVEPPANKGLTVPAGSGVKFDVRLDRHDGWDGPVKVTIDGLPDGFSTGGPLEIQSGHYEVAGALRVAADAETPTEEQWKAVSVTATGIVDGAERTQELGPLGPLTVGPPPKFTIRLEPDSGSRLDAAGNLVLRPGETITAQLVMDRRPGGSPKEGEEADAFGGEQKFDLFGMAHGVIVDNIGLSGVLIRKGETQRQIFLTAADWDPPSVRPVFARSTGEGGQCSNVVWVRVAKPGEAVAQAP